MTWKPKNRYDWVLVVNILLTGTFTILLIGTGQTKYAVMQFMLGFAISVLSIKRSQEYEFKKEFKRITGEKNDNDN